MLLYPVRKLNEILYSSFLRGKSNLANRLDGQLRGRGDTVTPGTATIGRGPPNYQRMASCESRGSDKAD